MFVEVRRTLPLLVADSDTLELVAPVPSLREPASVGLKHSP
jgi:hypothetical protein